MVHPHQCVAWGEGDLAGQGEACAPWLQLDAGRKGQGGCVIAAAGSSGSNNVAVGKLGNGDDIVVLDDLIIDQAVDGLVVDAGLLVDRKDGLGCDRV